MHVLHCVQVCTSVLHVSWDSYVQSPPQLQAGLERYEKHCGLQWLSKHSATLLQGVQEVSTSALLHTLPFKALSSHAQIMNCSSEIPRKLQVNQ